MKRTKKTYLKKGIESLLITIEMLIIAFVAITIESIGNATYNKILLVIMIIFILVGIILNKYSRALNED